MAQLCMNAGKRGLLPSAQSLAIGICATPLVEIQNARRHYGFRHIQAHIRNLLRCEGSASQDNLSTVGHA